jgi:hypothetical protein
MLTIPIQVSGDVWNNKSSAKELLDQTTPGQEIMLDLCSEGPSLRLLGIVDLISQYNLDVSITRWSNGVEEVPYKKVFCNTTSHFFPMSYHYWVDEISNIVPAEFRFGLFQGRGCPSRNRILYDAVNVWPGKFLLSKMQSNHGSSWEHNGHHTTIELEGLSEWFDDVERARAWFNECPVKSIDNHVIQDQYKVPEVSSGNMAKSLFKHYPRFNVELVCETYTLGETFFPTEKTIRPMVGNRPFVIYGPINYLNNLRQRGFRTFDTLWDESYDQYEGRKRWQAMTTLVNYLLSIDDQQWQDIVAQTLVITQHNRNIVRQMIRDLKGI